MMNFRLKKGRQGEDIACDYLQEKGLILIAKNWYCRGGEVDLIMEDSSTQTRVFVEVRLRQQTMFGTAIDTVFWQKQQKLIRTARVYQVKEQWWGDIRFDVVAITLPEHPENSPFIEHVAHAFMAE